MMRLSEIKCVTSLGGPPEFIQLSGEGAETTVDLPAEEGETSEEHRWRLVDAYQAILERETAEAEGFALWHYLFALDSWSLGKWLAAQPELDDVAEVILNPTNDGFHLVRVRVSQRLPLPDLEPIIDTLHDSTFLIQAYREPVPRERDLVMAGDGHRGQLMSFLQNEECLIGRPDRAWRFNYKSCNAPRSLVSWRTVG